VPEHMGMNRTEVGAPGSGADEVVHRLPRHRLAAFGRTHKFRTDFIANVLYA
jgi:hypothetical protein